MKSDGIYDQKLWGGRFQKKASEISERISESISFDRKLYSFDIQASKAYAETLARQDVISKETARKMIQALSQIQEEIEKDEFNYSISLEDIHTHIEKRLIELIGEDGKKLHTGRSRNDQVAVDTHLYLKSQAGEQYKLLGELLGQMLDLAQENLRHIWLGYTHLQVAQPVSLGHYLLAYFWKFLRDAKLLRFSLNEMQLSPLGAAALAGPNYSLDPLPAAKKLGFRSSYPNSMDAVSSRDYQLSYHFFASRFFIHLSQICEDIILFSSVEFNYVTLGDEVTTGSSIMPQKKNPDIAELLRGKSARVIGNLVSLLVNLKALPQTYNRDLQEDKIYLFDNCEQVILGIQGLSEILSHIRFHPERVQGSLEKGFAQATDLADHLVSEYRISFREAHETTGGVIAYCEKNKKTLEELSTEELISLLPQGVSLPEGFFDMKKSLERKNIRGATSPKRVTEQIQEARSELKSL